MTKAKQEFAAGGVSQVAWSVLRVACPDSQSGQTNSRSGWPFGFRRFRTLRHASARFCSVFFAKGGVQDQRMEDGEVARRHRNAGLRHRVEDRITRAFTASGLAVNHCMNTVPIFVRATGEFSIGSWLAGQT